ncbi:Nocturnin [Halotydeus destructor]|nr:Nocturnin [Halotydeus destructor]
MQQTTGNTDCISNQMEEKIHFHHHGGNSFDESLDTYSAFPSHDAGRHVLSGFQGEDEFSLFQAATQSSWQKLNITAAAEERKGRRDHHMVLESTLLKDSVRKAPKNEEKQQGSYSVMEVKNVESQSVNTLDCSVRVEKDNITEATCADGLFMEKESNDTCTDYSPDSVASKIHQPLPAFSQLEKYTLSDEMQLSNVRNMNDLKLFSLKKCLQSSPIATSSFFRRQFVKLGNSKEKCPASVTVMQWNMLSQAIGFHYENFVTCSQAHLRWSARKWKIIYEIAQYAPDVVCIQEIDRYAVIQAVLSKVGYQGRFVAKPDSPCNHIPGSLGPDGCAIFYNTKKYTLIKSSSKILDVFQEPSNQVILVVHLRCKLTGRAFVVATTHLKARKGPVLAALRNEQGKDIIRYLASEADRRPLILTGDFNAEAIEPVYHTLTDQLSSAYCEGFPGDTMVSNWTHRANESVTKQTVDYIFYSPYRIQCTALLDLYSKNHVKPIPNENYPSDHLSLIGQFEIV